MEFLGAWFFCIKCTYILQISITSCILSISSHRKALLILMVSRVSVSESKVLIVILVVTAACVEEEAQSVLEHFEGS